MPGGYIAELPEPIDLLVIAASAAQLPEIVRETVESGKVQAAIMIPGGVGETEERLLGRLRELRRLRELLDSSFEVGEKILVAELMSVNLDPFKHQIVINKGELDRIYPGQPLLDADVKDHLAFCRMTGDTIKNTYKVNANRDADFVLDATGKIILRGDSGGEPDTDAAGDHRDPARCDGAGAGGRRERHRRPRRTVVRPPPSLPAAG